MKASFMSTALRTALEHALKATNQRGVLPILRTVLLSTTRDATVSLRSTNLEIALEMWIPARVYDYGSVAINAKALLDFVKAVGKDERIEIVADTTTATVSGGSLSTNLPAIPAEEYPASAHKATSKVQWYAILRSADLKPALDSVVAVASVEANRPILTGAQFVITGQRLELAASDAFRIIATSVPLEARAVRGPAVAVIPATTLALVSRLIGKDTESLLTLQSLSPTQACFVLSNATVYTRVIDGTFPNYSAVLPVEFTGAGTVNKKDLIRAAKATKATIARVTFEPDQLVIAGKDFDSATRSVIPLDQYDGETQTIGFNPRYFEDLSHAPTERVILRPGTSIYSPITIEPTDGSPWKYAVMPVRLKDAA